jgi:DNA-binding NarL/FixJ family response regulator
MLAILLADDHDIVRDGLKALIQTEFPNALFGEAKDSVDVLREVHTRSWDIVVLDLSMPGEGGLETLRKIKQVHAAISVLVLSMHPESQFAMRVLKEGAAGYISKGAPRAELIRALRAVCAGRRYISATLAESIAFNLLTPDTPPHQLLSNREYQIMLSVAAGKAVSEIAAELEISIKTVSTYKKRVLEKLRLNTNADLTRYVLENHLLYPGAYDKRAWNRLPT